MPLWSWWLIISIFTIETRVFTSAFKMVMPNGHHHDAGRQCLESPPGLVQCVCAPSCPDHWKPVNTSSIYIVFLLDINCDRGHHDWLTLQVCGSDGVSYDNHCLLHRAACTQEIHISPIHDGFCRCGQRKKWTRKRDMWIWISKHFEILFLQTCNIVKIKKKLGNTPGAMELLNIFQHKREK